MDAISFVLGVKTSQLRSNQLQELIFKDETSAFDTANVVAFYEHDSKVTEFKRIILPNGSSEFRINNKTTSFKEYLKVLEKENVLVKARNFLVFQGDVEQVASQSPKDLTMLIEQISGSFELKEEYDRLKALQDTATESSTLNFSKKRQINQEMKQMTEQKTEAKRFEKLKEKRQKLIELAHLWKIYHLEKQLKEIEQERENLGKSQGEYKAKKASLQQEGKKQKQALAKFIKQATRLEQQVSGKDKEVLDYKPEMLEVEEGLKHTKLKLISSQAELNEIQVNHAKQEKDLQTLEKDLKNINLAIAEHESNQN
jgi:structural maintenance of chromosome 1